MKNYLTNLKYLLDHGHDLRIGFFGGSITQGAGASVPEEASWRALVRDWFRETYSQSGIYEVNAAIGGTGSSLGVFRCEQDLLTGNPDLVFIEFAINDHQTERERIIRCIEGIVRKIWKKNPLADIVFIYTTAKCMDELHKAGEKMGSIQAHQVVANHYGIPVIDVGEALYRQIVATTGNWDDYLPDTTHPNDRGYRIYAHEILSNLQKWLMYPVGTEKKPVVLASALDRKNYKTAGLLDSWTVTEEALPKGWIRLDQSLARRYPHMIGSDLPGSRLKVRIRSTVIGIYWMMSPDSGDMAWRIDKSDPVRISSWDRFCLNSSRAHYKILNDSLPPGEHDLEIEVLEEKNPASKGNWIRIGAFLVLK